MRHESAQPKKRAAWSGRPIILLIIKNSILVFDGQDAIAPWRSHPLEASKCRPFKNIISFSPRHQFPFFSHSMHIMQVTLPLFFFCLWQISISADSTCYWPNGSAVPDHFTYTPCNQTVTGVDSACCGSGDPCSPNGYCFGSAGYVYRGGCTDINWDTDACCPSCRNGTEYFLVFDGS